MLLPVTEVGLSKLRKTISDSATLNLAIANLRTIGKDGSGVFDPCVSKDAIQELVGINLIRDRGKDGYAPTSLLIGKDLAALPAEN